MELRVIMTIQLADSGLMCTKRNKEFKLLVINFTHFGGNFLNLGLAKMLSL